jgi:RNA polymerase primary sigma factor
MDQLTKIYVKELKNNHSNHEETLELIKKTRQGDEDARNLLISNYLLSVVKIANQFTFTGIPLGDLISEGNIGLMTAIEKFEPGKGNFYTYAEYWIKQAIRRNCYFKKGVVRLPENVIELMRSDRWKGPNYREFSIDLPNDEGDSMSESIPDTSDFDPFNKKEESSIMKNKVERILSFLHSRDAEIVKACYGIDREEPMEIPKVAELFNLSTTRICQILRSSIKKIRIDYNSLPEAKVKEVEIVSAKYGTEDQSMDVTDKVLDLYLANEIVKSNNKLGGDPCPGIVKALTIQYIYQNSLLIKVFPEGSVVKF